MKRKNDTKPRKSQPTFIRLTPDQRADLKARAEEERRDMTGQLLTAIDAGWRALYGRPFGQRAA